MNKPSLSTMRRIQQRITFGQLNKAIAQSHRHQTSGVDYQEAAHDAALDNGIDPLSEEYNQLSSVAGPGCTCSFCTEAFKDCVQHDDGEPIMYSFD